MLLNLFALSFSPFSFLLLSLLSLIDCSFLSHITKHSIAGRAAVA